MFSFDASSIDKSLPVAVGTQLYGLLSYVLSHSDIPRGTKLPSVRQLASDLGIAPMTVSQVYKQLRDAGLIEVKRGLGAFSARDPHRLPGKEAAMASLRKDVESLIAKAAEIGMTPDALSLMVRTQARLGKTSGLSIVFVGIFEKPARDYIEEIRPYVAGLDEIRLVTLEQLKASEEARDLTRDADLVLTFVHREVEVKSLVPDAAVLAIRFIPSVQTRQALAGLAPGMRVAAISYFEDYIAIMRPSVREFAPHISEVLVSWASAPDLVQTIARADAVIYATGADDVGRLVRPGIPCFEFRHAPDPAALENVLVPHLAQLRSEAAPRKGQRRSVRLGKAAAPGLKTGRHWPAIGENREVNR